ncbi:DUF899 family protein [Streptomyces pharetrae]
MSDRAPTLPTVTDRASCQAELDRLRIRERAHTRVGDAIAAARRCLPMVEVATEPRTDRCRRAGHPARSLLEVPSCQGALAGWTRLALVPTGIVSAGT